ncbi:DUF4239 domain-containing protein [Streptomyces sp. ms191]|uniref:bestrophin-like domain n=1 Tax=unclassified Streptomyces TaxID=2593676 RepID=UPI0011CD4349|nr:DUF4239 domain-containing protein [Streptomyces sp. ms191]TXS34465.1 DUF4239 domain-containing protein [Streptomyces sp. ms191]
MILWLLNHLDTFALAVLIVGGTVGLSLLGSVLVRRRHPKIADGEHNDMVGVVLGMFGAIYGIILAFVIVTLWTQMESTQNVVAAEATDIALIVRDARAFPAEDRDRVHAAAGGYVHTVVEVQWPLMRDGVADYRVTGGKLDDLYAALQSFEPRTESEKTFYAEAAARLDDVAAERRARLTMAGQQLPPLLQVLAVGGALVIIPLTFLYGMRSRRMQLLFVGAVAALIGFSLLLVVVLDRPFAGELSVSPAPYKEGALAQFWEPGPETPTARR